MMNETYFSVTTMISDQKKQRQDAQHVLRRNRHRMVRPAEHFLDGVQRAGADVAVDDAERGQRQRGQTLLVLCFCMNFP
jgi:hypothetical protein